MASELPPFSEVTSAPASHCGMGATAQSPEADSTEVSRLPRIQAPITRLAIDPSARPWYHSSLHDVTGATRSSSIICCHVVANFCVPSSEKSTVTSVPSTW